MTNLLAVYGTLRRGRNNHQKYLGNSKYVGAGKVPPGYRLVVDWLPHLITDTTGEGCVVELYEVINSQLSELDKLEGHPDFYRRELIDIVIGPDNITTKAWVYLSRISVKGRTTYDFNK